MFFNQIFGSYFSCAFAQHNQDGTFLPKIRQHLSMHPVDFPVFFHSLCANRAHGQGFKSVHFYCAAHLSDAAARNILQHLPVKSQLARVSDNIVNNFLFG
jgi:hypothetical protein